MTTDTPRLRLAVLANLHKEVVREALVGFLPWLRERADVVIEPDDQAEEDCPPVEMVDKVDMGIVLGGDGTMLAMGRRLAAADTPLLGVNFGKLGFLAEFSLDDVKQHWDAIASDGCRKTERMLLEAAVFEKGLPEWGVNGGDLPEPVFEAVAMNDAVLTAGPPFRLIEVGLTIEPDWSRERAATLRADGVVVATPSGSTAYNLAAGGPIVSPGVDGICVTAVCPHSLNARPIVCQAECEVWMMLDEANEGTTLVIDGQERCPMLAGQQVRVRRHDKTLTLLHNPSLNYWTMLSHKMHWGKTPRIR